MHEKFNRLFLVLLISSLTLNIFLLIDIKEIRRDLDNTRNSMNSLEYRLDSSIGSLRYNIEETLNKSASNVSNFTHEITGYKDKKVDLILKVVPKSIGANDKFYFNLKYDDGTTKTIDAYSNDSINYVGATNISIYDSIDVDLIIDNGEIKKIEKLPTVISPEYKLTEGVNVHPSGGSWSHYAYSNFITYSSKFYMEFYDEIDNTSRIVSDVNLFIEKNGIIIETIPMTKSTDRFDSNQLVYEAELKDYKLYFEPNNKISIFATAKDSKGFIYKALLERLIVNENNELRSDHSSYPSKVTIE